MWQLLPPVPVHVSPHQAKPGDRSVSYFILLKILHTTLEYLLVLVAVYVYSYSLSDTL